MPVATATAFRYCDKFADCGNYTTRTLQEKGRTARVFRLLQRRNEVPVHRAESRVALGVKSQAGTVQNFAIEDHGFDLARVVDALGRIARNDQNIGGAPGLQAAPFFLGMHNARGVGGGGTNGLRSEERRVGKECGTGGGG